MGPKPTKTDRIRYLCLIGLTNKEIKPVVEKEFGATSAAYIRVITGQRLHQPTSKADRKYIKSFIEKHGCFPEAARQRKRREQVHA